MRLTARSALADVAVVVGDALRRAGIRAVLTGGACANVYTRGAHLSVDADFVLAESCTADRLDRALSELGFERRRDRFVHPRILFVVEFPRGPLRIGDDFRIRPVWVANRGARALALSPTDACRDRLAAFYHWTDWQSLVVAVSIALRHRVSLAKIRSWSLSEGHGEGFKSFLAELARAKPARGLGRSGRKRPTRAGSQPSVT